MRIKMVKYTKESAPHFAIEENKQLRASQSSGFMRSVSSTRLNKATKKKLLHQLLIDKEAQHNSTMNSANVCLLKSKDSSNVMATTQKDRD